MLYFTDSHREALAVLCYGLLERKGLMLLLGHAGTGKTTLLARAVLGLPPSRVQFASIVNPTVTSAEFMETVLLGFGIREIPASKPQRLARLEKHLLQTQMEGRIAALIVDEAHKLSTDALEEIRLLGNLERRSEKLLQIILAGQNDLLSPAEVSRYIACRWARAGGRQRAPFSQQALELTARVSEGIPRLINVVCDNALIAAFGEQSRMVEASHVSQSCVELDLLDGLAEAVPNSELILSPGGEQSEWDVADTPARSARNRVSAAGR